MVDLVAGGIVLFAIMVAAGIVPLIMAVKAKVRSLRILSLLLGLFAVVHGFYHLASGYQQDFLADAVFEPHEEYERDRFEDRVCQKVLLVSGGEMIEAVDHCKES